MNAVIVGHGPSILEKCWGPEIDRFDAVVRMKWGHTGTGQSPNNFGTRTDYLCSTLRTAKSYSKLPLKEYWGYENVRCGRNHYPIAKEFGDTPMVVEQHAINYWIAVYDKLRQRGVPHFSTGMATIVMACKRLKPKTLTLAGFDNIVSGETENYKSIWREDGFEYPEHQWDVEHQMVPLITEYYETKLRVMR